MRKFKYRRKAYATLLYSRVRTLCENLSIGGKPMLLCFIREGAHYEPQRLSIDEQELQRLSKQLEEEYHVVSQRTENNDPERETAVTAST